MRIKLLFYLRSSSVRKKKTEQSQSTTCSKKTEQSQPTDSGIRESRSTWDGGNHEQTKKKKKKKALVKKSIKVNRKRIGEAKEREMVCFCFVEEGEFIAYTLPPPPSVAGKITQTTEKETELF